MAPEELRQQCIRQPFEPFRMVMTDGKTYDVTHPDLLLVTRRAVFMGVYESTPGEVFDRSVILDPLHIVHTESLPAQYRSGKNGKKKR